MMIRDDDDDMNILHKIFVLAHLLGNGNDGDINFDKPVESTISKWYFFIISATRKWLFPYGL